MVRVGRERERERDGIVECEADHKHVDISYMSIGEGK